MANKIAKLNERQENYWQEYDVVGDASNVVYNIDNDTPNVESVLTSIANQAIAPGGGYWEDCNDENLAIDFDKYTDTYLCNAGHYYVFVGVVGYDNNILTLDLYTAFDVFRGVGKGYVHYQQINVNVNSGIIGRPTLFMGVCNLFLFIPCDATDNNIVQIITYKDLYEGNIGWEPSVLSYPNAMPDDVICNTYSYYKQGDYIIAKGKQTYQVDENYGILTNLLHFNVLITDMEIPLSDNVSEWNLLIPTESSSDIYQCEDFLHDDMIDLIIAYKRSEANSGSTEYIINPYSGEIINSYSYGVINPSDLTRALHKACLLMPTVLSTIGAVDGVLLHSRELDFIDSHMNILPTTNRWHYIFGNDYRLYAVSKYGDIAYGNEIYNKNHIDFVLVNQNSDEDSEGRKSLKSYCLDYGDIIDAQFCTDEDNINIVALLIFDDGTKKLLRTCVDTVV